MNKKTLKELQKSIIIIQSDNAKLIKEIHQVKTSYESISKFNFLRRKEKTELKDKLDTLKKELRSVFVVKEEE